MPDTPPTSDVLPSPRHEKFAQLMATGELAAWEAYAKCYPNAEESTCRSNGPELLRKTHIYERVSQIQKGAAKATSMSLEEWRAWHEGVMRTPIGELDENSPYAQEKTVEIRGGKRGRLKRGDAEEGNEEDEPVIEVVKIKVVSKQESAKQLADHHGWLKTQETKVTVAGLDELLASLSRPGLPQEPEAKAQDP